MIAPTSVGRPGRPPRERPRPKRLKRRQRLSKVATTTALRLTRRRSMLPLQVHRLGLVEYEDGLKLQAEVGRARAAGLIPDSLLLLEHPAVLTLGRSAKRHHILASPEQLEARDIQVFETNRGGDVTYHGPGQLVGYPVFKLEGKRQDV